MASFPVSSWNKKGALIDDDFPLTARTGLVYLISDLLDKNYMVNPSSIILEINRIGRFDLEEFFPNDINDYINQISQQLIKLDWNRVYYFCERVYSKLLQDVDYGLNGPYTSISEVQTYYSDEINALLKEDNLAFTFENGQFQRVGRIQTQKLFERMGAVLADSRLIKVKNHYNKARNFFNIRPIPDLENTIKESICALEACIEILTGKDASKDFDKAIKQLEGNNIRQIPFPIGESMIKFHSYRGSGQGVAHASLQGNKVTIPEAELILNMVASYITYLVDVFPFPNEDLF